MRQILTALTIVALAAFTAQAATTWTGTAGDQDWFNNGNWDNNAPGDGSAAVIGADADVLLTNETAELGSLTVSGGTLTFSNWTTRLVATNVTINGGTVTLPVAFTNAPAMSNRIWIVCSNLTVASGAAIDADSKGYAEGTPTRNGQGPGGGISATTGAGGAGHGAAGGKGYTGAGGVAYGSASAPEAPGSGGGGTPTDSGRNGGSGGGAVRIEASGAVVVNGTITANGTASGHNRTGGGSGGSIYVECNTFQGAGGEVLADGGNSGTIGGASAGGRIAVAYEPTAQAALGKPTVRFSAKRGTSGYNNGDIGTLHFPDETVLHSTWLPHTGVLVIPALTNWSIANLTFSNCWIRMGGTGLTLNVTGDLRVTHDGIMQHGEGGDIRCGGDLVLTNNSFLYVYGGVTNPAGPSYGSRLSLTGDLVIVDNSQFTPVSHVTNGGSPYVTVRSLTVDATSQINGDAKGFGACLTQSSDGFGPGKGRYANGYGGGGGGYGGKGGTNNSGEISRGVTYGDANTPAQPGSGAGCQTYGSSGGYGGGLVHIEADRQMTIDGTVSVNGQNGASRAGGGSGGGIFLLTRVFAGGSNSVLSANGGKGASWSGAGGGGRIAVQAGHTTFWGAATVTNGTGPYGEGAELGTVSWIALDPVISNVAAVGITGTEAWLVGNLWSTGGIPSQVDGAPTEVSVFWGTNDGGTVKGDWQTNDSLGFPEVGVLSNKLATLSAQTQYYFRFYATNTWGDEWAAATVNFGTVGGATVNNGGGAASLGQTSATLCGDVTSGNPMPVAFICWGDSDPMVDSTGAWSHVVDKGLQLGPYSNEISGLLANRTYYYRCHVTNTFGPGWAPAATNFTTLSPMLTIDDVQVTEGALSTSADAVFTLTLSSTSAVDVAVEFATADGEAEAGSDYDATNGTLVIPAGSLAGTITVVVRGDDLDEYPSQDFYLNLSNGNDVVIADAQGHGSIVDDDDVGIAKSWTGTGHWTTHTNWSPVGCPSPADTVTILSGNCTMSNSEAVASLTVADTATLTMTNWTTKLTATETTIANGGTVTLPPAFLNDGPSNRVWMACSNLTLEAGGSIDVDVKGFAGVLSSSGMGPGGGSVGAAGAGGGSYGGLGGKGWDGPGGPLYGSSDAPVQPGSAGGGCAQDGGTYGGNGGGAVQIEALGTVTINGTISANGGNGTSRAAGGSGGGVYIACDRFAGTDGVVQANAGKSTGIGGGGGGGRIVVVYSALLQTSMPKPSVRFSASGNVSQGGYGDGDLGSLYFPDLAILNGAWFPHTGTLYMDGVPRWAPDQLTISNGWLRIGDAGMDLEITNDLKVTSGGILQMVQGGNILCGGDLILTNSSKLYVYGAATNGVDPSHGTLISVTNDMIIASGAELYPVSQSTNGGSPLLRMRNLTIDAGGQINADFVGYAGAFASYGEGYGPGKGGVNGDNRTGGGGGYGGNGGEGYRGGPGATYGSSNAPVYPGSGGGSGYGAAGFGGGLARIEAQDMVTVNGTISANGTARNGNGSGAGGGIFVRCRRFAGGSDGFLRAEGGGGGASAGAGGGGGRIAIWWNVPNEDADRIINGSDLRRVVFTNSVDTYAGSVSVLGGADNFSNGADGTFVVVTVTPVKGSVFLIR